MSDYPALDFWDLSKHIMVALSYEGKTGAPLIPWDVLANAFGPRIWFEFTHWMRGQTSTIEGAYPWDVERFLQGKPIID